MLLGPSLLGAELSQTLFPLETRPFLALLAGIGLVLFTFVVGLELDVSLVRGRGRVAASVSITSILLPFSLGVGLATFLDGLRPPGVDFLPFALFLRHAQCVQQTGPVGEVGCERGAANSGQIIDHPVQAAV